MVSTAATGTCAIGMDRAVVASPSRECHSDGKREIAALDAQRVYRIAHLIGSRTTTPHRRF